MDKLKLLIVYECMIEVRDQSFLLTRLRRLRHDKDTVLRVLHDLLFWRWLSNTVSVSDSSSSEVLASANDEGLLPVRQSVDACMAQIVAGYTPDMASIDCKVESKNFGGLGARMRVLDNIWAKTSPYLSWTFATVAFQRSISKSSKLFCEPQVEAKNWRKITDSKTCVQDFLEQISLLFPIFDDVKMLYTYC